MVCCVFIFCLCWDFLDFFLHLLWLLLWSNGYLSVLINFHVLLLLLFSICKLFFFHSSVVKKDSLNDFNLKFCYQVIEKCVLKKYKDMYRIKVGSSGMHDWLNIWKTFDKNTTPVCPRNSENWKYKEFYQLEQRKQKQKPLSTILCRNIHGLYQYINY